MATSEPILNVPRSVAGGRDDGRACKSSGGYCPTKWLSPFCSALAFIPARYSGAAPELPGGYIAAVTSFVTYMVVHAGWVHLVVNLALDGCFRQRSGAAHGRTQDFSLSRSCAASPGALTHLLFHFGEMAPVVGASAAISGQMAAALRFIFRAEASARPAHARFSRGAAESLGETLSDQRIILIHRVLGWRSTYLRSRRGEDASAPREQSPGRPISAAFCSASVFRLLRPGECGGG